MGDPAFAHLASGIQAEPWSLEAELALLREMEIGIMPLSDTPWTRGKCGLKGLLSMAMGAATVMSPVGVNSEIVRHGENGFLATTEDEWFSLLSRLVEDVSLRRRLGSAARETVTRGYSVRRWEGVLADILARAAAQS